MGHIKPATKEQFNDAYEQYVDVVFRLCKYKVGVDDTAEDLTQDVFVKYWNYLVQGKKVSNTKSFLYQIARNLIIDHYRKHKSVSLDQLHEDGFDPGQDSQQVNQSEANLAIKAIKGLDEKYRDAVYLRLVDEMGVKDIAKVLDISESNASVRIHRGIKQLQEKFA